MKKQIVISLAVIAAVAAAAVGGTMALFSDTETSNGNIFTAGAIDLKVDHTYASYDGQECDHCTVPENAVNLVTNGGFENPNLSTGQWQVYPAIPGWTGEGAGIEVQDNAAGAPHSGSQHVELDSHGLADSRSAMYQDIVTVPGQKYRLSFWQTHRPNNGPAADNQISVRVTVSGDSGTVVDQTIGSSQGGSVDWQEFIFDFVALDSLTRVRFADAGTEADTLGGYLDDVSVYGLDCPTDQYVNGGTCTLWSEKDLGPNDKFWNFTDVKPGDWGKDTISLHVYNNDAFVCLMPSKIEDDENGVVDPEKEAGDTLADGINNGELSGALQFFMWNDANANNTYDTGEDVLVPAGTPMNSLPNQVALALSSPAPATLLGVQWCAGTQTRDGDVVGCDGDGMSNKTQTDKAIADFVAYAVQQRNNSEFSCKDLLKR